jgi:hypothetical protein
MSGGAKVEDVLTVIRATPSRIAALTDGLGDEQLHAAGEAGEWSVNGILAHLRACADVWGDYIAAILAEDHPILRGSDPRTWIKKTDYPELPFRTSLRAFRTQRAALIAILEVLPPHEWARAATIVGGGRQVERTVLSYAESLAHHEGVHLKQIERTVRAVMTSLL